MSKSGAGETILAFLDSKHQLKLCLAGGWFTLNIQAHILMVVSQEAVPMAVPSGETFNDETLFSWP